MKTIGKESSSKKTDDYSKQVEAFRMKGSNKQCFDCGANVFFNLKTRVPHTLLNLEHSFVQNAQDCFVS